MNVQNIDNTVFTSRNKTIRKADDIARKACTLFDTVSSSKIHCYKNAKNFEYLRSYIYLKTRFMREMKDKLYETGFDFYKKIEALINPVKLYRIANCGEKSHLACIMAKTYGIKDCHIAHLFQANGKDLDHAVVFVNDKKPYIIDAWLGFADYVPNALKRYKGEYKQYFDFSEGDTIAVASKYDDEFTDFLKGDFSRKERKEIKKLYPEMDLKRN